MGAIILEIGSKIEVNYNNYAGFETSYGIAPLKKTYQKKNIEVSINSNGFCEAWFNHLSQQIPISFNGSDGTFQVDSVNAVVPTSNENLYDLLKAII